MFVAYKRFGGFSIVGVRETGFDVEIFTKTLKQNTVSSPGVRIGRVVLTRPEFEDDSVTPGLPLVTVAVCSALD